MSQRAQRLIEAARKLPVPEGTYAVGLGLIISGHHRLRVPDPGVPGLDQVRLRRAQRPLGLRVRPRARLLPPARAGGGARGRRPSRPRHRRRARRPQGRAGGALLAALVADRPDRSSAFDVSGFADRLFHGQEVLLVCFLIALVTYAVQHLTRGTLSGNGRFGPYGDDPRRRGHHPDRCPLIAARTRSAIDNLVWYGLALAIPPVLASRRVAARPARAAASPGPTPWSELSTNLSLLLPRVAAAQALSYAPPSACSCSPRARRNGPTPPTSSSASSSPASRSCCSRPCRPRCSRSSPASPAPGKHDDFRTGLSKLVMIVVGVGVLGVIGRRHHRPDRRQDPLRRQVQPRQRRPRAAARGSALFILALTLAQALIALLGHGRALIAWAVGLVRAWSSWRSALGHHRRPVPPERAGLPRRLPSAPR